jgi:hypothetical protein
MAYYKRRLHAPEKYSEKILLAKRSLHSRLDSRKGRGLAIDPTLFGQEDCF